MPFAIGYQDYARKGVISGGAWLSTLPLSNLLSDDIREVARSASANTGDTQFVIDTGTVPTVGMVVIGPINASPAAQYRVRSFADLALTQVAYDSTLRSIQSGTVINWAVPNSWLEWEDPNFWMGIVPSELVDLPLYIVLTIPAAQMTQGQARFWKVEIQDASNPDGAVEIGAVMLMRIFRPEYNYAPDGNSTDINFLQDMEESKGGRRTYDEIAIRRAVRFSWPMIDEAEAFDDWMRIGLLSRTSRRIFILPEENETGEHLRLRAFPATFTKSPPIAQMNVSLGSTSVDAEEVL